MTMGFDGRMPGLSRAHDTLRSACIGMANVKSEDATLGAPSERRVKRDICHLRVGPNRASAPIGRLIGFPPPRLGLSCPDPQDVWNDYGIRRSHARSLTCA